MRNYLLLFFVLCVLSVHAQPPDNPEPDVYYYHQRFDHINPLDTRIWLQRYLVYDKYWKGDGPIFFCPGGEGDVMGGYYHNGLMFELGKKLGAFLLFPEHRFYGQSLPFGPEVSYLPENIRKLTVEQAMIDFIIIINHVKEQWNISITTPLIAFGGSYPGDLTVYLRVAYPEVIDGGLAASAPVLYHTGFAKNGAFYEVVTEDFAKQDPNCPDLVRRAFSMILELATTQQGREIISQKLQLCSVLEDDTYSLRVLALWAENAFATLAMLDYPYPTEGLPANALQYSCSVMKSYQDPIIALGYTLGVFYNTSSSPIPCFDIAAEFYPCADITGCGGGIGDPDALSWDFQSCTEIVSNIDTNNVTDMFPPALYNLTALEEYCNKTWGTIPNPNFVVDHYNYTTTTRLILSNGGLDPWTPGGVLPEQCPEDKEIYCFIIDNAAHHLDLWGTDPKNDPPAVTQARLYESAIISKWVTLIKKEKEKKFLVLE